MVDRVIVEKNSRAERERIVRGLSQRLVNLNRQISELEEERDIVRKAKAEISERL